MIFVSSGIIISTTLCCASRFARILASLAQEKFPNGWTSLPFLQTSNGHVDVVRALWFLLICLVRYIYLFWKKSNRLETRRGIESGKRRRKERADYGRSRAHVLVFVMPTNEELLIARDTASLVATIPARF